MTTVFLATLGQRPEAITMALDALHPRYRFEGVDILHTDPEHSDIADAYHTLMAVLRADYADLTIRTEHLCHADGRPIRDITDGQSAEAYFLALLEVLRRYRAAYQTIHLLVSGGRKAMSVYATLAAAALFGEHDRVWTILTPHDLMQAGVFHLPPGHADRAQMVPLPVFASRFLPGELANQTAEDIRARVQIAPREAFLRDLTEEEGKLAEMIRLHPYLSNVEIAAQMTKSVKTIETQLSSIYDKLLTHFALNVNPKQKRRALLDVLDGRV